MKGRQIVWLEAQTKTRLPQTGEKERLKQVFQQGLLGFRTRSNCGLRSVPLCETGRKGDQFSYMPSPSMEGRQVVRLEAQTKNRLPQTGEKDRPKQVFQQGLLGFRTRSDVGSNRFRCAKRAGRASRAWGKYGSSVAGFNFLNYSRHPRTSKYFGLEFRLESPISGTRLQNCQSQIRGQPRQMRVLYGNLLRDNNLQHLILKAVHDSAIPSCPIRMRQLHRNV